MEVPPQSLRDSSPKGTPFGAAAKFPATAEAVPLGKVASPQAMTEGVNQLFPSTTPPVKMRLERSAERDKREILNNNSAEYAQSNAERIPNRPTRKRQICPPPFLCPQSVVY